jgi:hypothetical protein
MDILDPSNEIFDIAAQWRAPPLNSVHTPSPSTNGIKTRVARHFTKQDTGPISPLARPAIRRELIRRRIAGGSGFVEMCDRSVRSTRNPRRRVK